MTDLVKRVADAVYHRDSTDTYAIARVAIKTVLDDMREFVRPVAGYNNPVDKMAVDPRFWYIMKFIDAFEKDRMK